MADEGELFEQFGGLFGELFGTGQPGRSARTSRDLRTDLRISFAEAVDGGSREVELQRWSACRACEGSGAPDGAEWSTCDMCDGSGKKQVAQGAFRIETLCEACRGAGRSTDESCASCDGEGGTTEVDEVTVQIPGGVRDGHELRLRGKGSDLATDEGPGDHYLVISVGSHPRLTRRGDDLATTLTLDPEVAREGAEVSVPIPTGSIPLQVPRGAKTGDTVRLPGQGAQKLGQPATPRPSASHGPFRSHDPTAFRGELVVTFVLEGDPLPDACHRAVLGVGEDANSEEIKAAYRKLALAHHPDRNPGDVAATRRFEEASAAFEALAGAGHGSAKGAEGVAGQVPYGLVVLGVIVLALAYVILTR